MNFKEDKSCCKFCLEGCKVTRFFIRLSWIYEGSRKPSEFTVLFKPADDLSSFSRLSIPVQETLAFDNKVSASLCLQFLIITDL